MGLFKATLLEGQVAAFGVELLAAVFGVGHGALNDVPERLGVVHDVEVGQLVDHHGLDQFGAEHGQPPAEAEGAVGAATAPAAPLLAHEDAGHLRPAHAREPVGDGLFEEPPCLFPVPAHQRIAHRFGSLLGDWCVEYSNDFTRRAMEDFAFTDREGFYSAIDVKTHRTDTEFNRPNLISVERLARFYKSDTNVFSLILVKYDIKDTKVVATEVTFTPIEFLDWECLAIGALGRGQIQIANSNVIKVVEGYSRKKWMLQLCDAMLEFYPKEILKIQDRIGRFGDVKAHWESREDIWS